MSIKDKLNEEINDNLIEIVISNPRTNENFNKISIRPILLKNSLVYQMSMFKNPKVFHANYNKESLIDIISGEIEKNYKQTEIKTTTGLTTILISKKGKVTITKKNKTVQKVQNLEHNRIKNYILEEGKPIPFLIDLGVMNLDGKIVKARYDKFKQINRFLEFIEDILPSLDRDRELTIIDFGCGKSYLTFAMYYYLNVLKGYNINVIGLDLKEDVINLCNELAKKYEYQKLKFYKGDISTYSGVDKVDMVVTLHACDTATDYALAKAVSWGAKVILSVPCCQHEINSQIKNEILEPIMKYGLLKERMSALITDGIRAELLETQGYKAQILEFIDMEHTPKNILIRAIKTDSNIRPSKELDTLKKFLNVNTTLEKLLK